MNNIKKFIDFVNESTINEDNERKIAKKYDVGDIDQLDMDDFPNRKEIEKGYDKGFRYIINDDYLSSNGQSMSDLRSELTKAKIDFTELKAKGRAGSDDETFILF